MKRNRNLVSLIVVMAVVLAALAGTAILIGHQEQLPEPTILQTNPTVITDPTQVTEETDPPTEPPTEPPITKIATATIASMGDMLMHMPVVNTGYDSATGEYNLEMIYDYILSHISGADLAVGNLETTLAGPDFVHDNGKVGYNGYPQFNCPDSIIDAMDYAGFDVVLTANNHSYDTRNLGFHRTMNVIADKGLSYLGSKRTEEEKDYIVMDCNGIRIGLICYTYEDSSGTSNKVALNGHTMTEADSKLVNCFNYSNLDVFYGDLAGNMTAMEADGAETIMLYIHWGDEYKLQPTNTQKKMAQELCNMGVDVIVGGHPHVVEPVQLLTSENDENQKTLCVYSLGNAVSNQRLGNISYVKTAHTEDGLLFNVTFAKYSDGTVIIESAEAIPTWVNMCYDADWNKRYYILPLDTAIEDWKAAFDLSDSLFAKAQESYARTAEILGTGMDEANAYYAANQQAVEALLGVQ